MLYVYSTAVSNERVTVRKTCFMYTTQPYVTSV